MAYATLPLAVTGAVVPAAWGNQARDNDEYLKGRSGATVNLENSVTSPATVTGVAGVVAGPSATAQFQFADRTTNQLWAWYASGGSAVLWNGSLGGLLSLVYGSAPNGGAAANAGVLPALLSQDALTGFLGAGTWTYSYNGDGTIASQVMNALGPLNGWAVTYEYSGGRLAVARLRIGGAAGTIVRSIGYFYDGSGRLTSEGHS